MNWFNRSAVRANPGTQKDGRFVTGPQREAAARCARVEDVANLTSLSI